jgi:Arc/MetJ family transcription regulator
MRTTVDLDEGLVREALRVTGARTKTEVLELGLKALVAKAARERAIALAGSMPALEAPPRRVVEGG